MTRTQVGWLVVTIGKHMGVGYMKNTKCYFCSKGRTQKSYVFFLQISILSVKFEVHLQTDLWFHITWPTWSTAFLPRGQDSSGMLTYDESILVAFGSQRIAHQSESIAQGPDGFPCFLSGIARVFFATGPRTESWQLGIPGFIIIHPTVGPFFQMCVWTLIWFSDDFSGWKRKSHHDFFETRRRLFGTPMS